MLETIGFRLTPAHRAARSPEIITESQGLYAFFLRPGVALPPEVPDPWLTLTKGRDKLGLLYVGATGETLQRRVKQHLRARTPASTMRMSLGLLLRQELGLEVRAHRRKRYFWFLNDEVLSEWLWANTIVGTRAMKDGFALEARINAEGGGLLNIAGVQPRPISQHLRRLRDEVAPPRTWRR